MGTDEHDKIREECYLWKVNAYAPSSSSIS